MTNSAERPFMSIVSPVYRADTMLDELVARIVASVAPITDSFEIILVDDRSPDNSWAGIQKQVSLDSRVKGLRLSRNFGQHRAITAGLDHSRGEWVVVMDCDLQDRPEEIPALLAKAQEGSDMVLARRFQRQDTFFKRLFSQLFYGTLGYLTGSRQDSAIANFGIYHRKVIDAICAMRESARYFPTMARWVGFRVNTLNVEHAERAEGTSSYNFKRLVNLALDIILAYSDKPLRLTVKAGLVISATAFLGAIYMLVRAIEGKIQVLGYASLIVSIWFFSGLIILIMGVIGLYLGKTFEGVKNRPIYVVDELIGPDTTPVTV
ncbi:glycosyltransferase family 2 protein [Hymenobacter algoricola]|uniref:Glycosyltransferase family 2 protein n=1 Tax=Hymenobacter algoricola TaxID=486267 RepID=A0ABP7NPF2_9BACT